MKILIPIICLMTLALAEPPVGDGYPATTSHNNHHHDHQTEDHQRSLSQEYGTPSETFSSARNAASDGYEYNAPNARSSLNTREHSQHPPPTVRVSFNQRFGSATARSSAQERKANDMRSHLPDYTAQNARSGINQEYGPPAARSLSQDYGVPSIKSARTLSTEYGMPEARSNPKHESSVPDVAVRANQKPHSPASNFRSASTSTKASSQDYLKPAARSQFQADRQSNEFDVPSTRSNNIHSYRTSKPAFASRSSSSSNYEAPSSRSTFSRNSESQEFVSKTHSAPSQRGLSANHDVPSARGLSQEYGPPSSRSNLMTEAISSSYASASSRSSPSSTYLPAARNAMPSKEYGEPELRDAASQGYDYARARALEELRNQEPASYDFGYQIEDQESGSDFGHTETREEERTQGSYFVVLPDGTKQTVDYEADERGFKPRISVEAADASARSGSGYDENAAEVAAARSVEGPY